MRDVKGKDLAVTDVLMSDYGLDSAHYEKVLEKVQEVRQKGLIHDAIYHSVCGVLVPDMTNDLREFLEVHKTRTPRRTNSDEYD